MGDFEEVFDPILGKNRAKDLVGSIAGGDHSTLSQLAYATSGHTGFEKSLTFSTGLTRTVDTITTNDSQIVHDNLSGFVANEHIDHSGVNINAGGILSGGGDITTSRTITLNHSDVDHDQTTNTHNLTTDIDHDQLTNFVSGEHFLQSAITQISAGVGDGLVKSISGTLSTITDNSANWNTAYGWGDHSVEGYLKNIVEDTSPQLGGDLDTNSNDIKFKDNDKAIFGTGLDAEIYSDSNDLIYRQLTQDRDHIWYVNDGGVDTEVMRVDGGLGEVFIGNAGSVRLTINQTGGTKQYLNISGDTSNAQALNISPTMKPVSGAIQLIRAVPTFEPQGSLSNIYSFNTSVRVGGSSSNNITNAYGTFAQFITQDSYSGTISNLYGVRSRGWVQDLSTGSPTVTNQFIFYADDPVVSGTNNYAFYSAVNSGTGKWGFYSAGTADNYFNGDTGFGLNNPSEKVHSSAKVRADTVFNVNGTDGVSGTFTTADAKTVTVTGGIITSIV